MKKNKTKNEILKIVDQDIKKMSITDIYKKLKISYSCCNENIKLLKKNNLVNIEKIGRTCYITKAGEI